MQFITPELVVCIFDRFFRKPCLLFWSWRRNCGANHDANAELLTLVSIYCVVGVVNLSMYHQTNIPVFYYSVYICYLYNSFSWRVDLAYFRGITSWPCLFQGNNNELTYSINTVHINCIAYGTGICRITLFFIKKTRIYTQRATSMEQMVRTGPSESDGEPNHPSRVRLIYCSVETKTLISFPQTNLQLTERSSKYNSSFYFTCRRWWMVQQRSIR